MLLLEDDEIPRDRLESEEEDFREEAAVELDGGLGPTAEEIASGESDSKVAVVSAIKVLNESPMLLVLLLPKEEGSSKASKSDPSFLSGTSRLAGFSLEWCG